MAFIKYLSIALLLMIMVGCSQQPTKDQASGKIESTDLSNSEESVDDESSDNQAPAAKENAKPAPVAAQKPNPYLRSPPSIPNLARNQFVRAKQATTAKQWTRAEALWLELQRMYPELSGGYVNLGVVYRNTGKPKKAIEQFTQAVSVNKNNFDAYNLWAITLREQGQFSEARKVYQRSLDRWPSQAAVHRNLGILYDLYLQDPASALRHYQLSQSLLSAPDKTLGIWIKDLSRQVN